MAERGCELADFGPPCGARTAWVVSVGSRKSDAQRSCKRHLSRTCEVLQGAENRTGVTFTVTPVEQWHWDRALIASAAEVFDELEVPE